jgi:sugar phosphate isomerase/epimerase
MRWQSGPFDAVWFEINCGWITRAGADPAAELKRFADRIIAIQMKNMAPNSTTTEDGWAATGDDIIDWGKIRTTLPRDNG